MPDLWRLAPREGGIGMHVYVVQPCRGTGVDVSIEGQGHVAPRWAHRALKLCECGFVHVVRAGGGRYGSKGELADWPLGTTELEFGARNGGAADAARSEQGRALRIQSVQTQIHLPRQGVVKMFPKPLSATAH